MFKRAKVVMLPTNKKANIKLGDNGLLVDNYMGYDAHFTNQHLYIISDDEIKEGDWYLSQTFPESNSNKFINQKPNRFIERYRSLLNRFKDITFKIIATTDLTLGTSEYSDRYRESYFNPLPQPSQSFIEKYVEEYNRGNIITDIMVEYSFKKNVIFGNMNFVEMNDDGSYYKCINCDVETTRSREFLIDHNCIVDELKLSKDNTITIRKLKYSWNRDEVIELITKAFKAGYERSHSGYPNTDNHTKPNIDKFIDINL